MTVAAAVRVVWLCTMHVIDVPLSTDYTYACDGGWGEGVVWVEETLDLEESGRGACCSGPAFYRES